MKKIGVAVVILAMIVGSLVFFGWVRPAMRAYDNTVDYAIHKVDEHTSYELKKRVEDESRAMVAAYNRDKTTYLQNKDNEDKFYRDLAQQAKIRANGTVATYNEYMLKNTFVWDHNVPADINTELPILE